MSRALSGRLTEDIDIWAVYAPNITPNVEAGIDGWSDAELVRAVRGGVSKDGRRLDVLRVLCAHFRRRHGGDHRPSAIPGGEVRARRRYHPEALTACRPPCPQIRHLFVILAKVRILAASDGQTA